MNKYFKHLGIMFLAFVAISVMSCQDDEGDEPDLKFNVKVINDSAFGNIMVNQKNETIYFFAGDISGASNCNGGCADAWPPVTGSIDDLELGTSLSMADFSMITRDGGEKQLAYKGWPLYYFAPDNDGVLETSASIAGDGRGGVFYIAKPDYSIMLGKQSVKDGEDAVTYLVDGDGLTLYDFVNDEENTSNCSGGCANAWPPFNPAGTLIIPSTLSASDFDTFLRGDDLGYQLTYKGLPLYYFTTDAEVRGVVEGEGGGNGNFFVVKPVL
ncbi:COG4315 family predicted lipoprotein [Fulvivirga ligni]|uniref:COG4315 family predicted lipoprotein n=1 Tax=Fulvivirga ligni TaxID=2904246 RepID=UPI001F28CA91|nr:hypothetical protein [Fulvivirga ligni]UII19318.1 hypothetical protein LVD16_15850 [Fulvivirga ligni]